MSLTSKGAMCVGGVPFRVCLMFALSPEEELTADDIAVKFETEKEGVRMVLGRAVIGGWLESEVRGRGRERFTVYKAGPQLLRATRGV